MSAKRIFTAEEKQLVKELYDQKVSVLQIKKKLKTTRPKILKIFKELDLIPRPKVIIKPSKKILSQVKKLFDKGYGIRSIVEQLNISTQTVIKSYKTLNLYRKPGESPLHEIHLSEEQEQKIIELFNKGYGIIKISRELNISTYSVESRYEKLGLFRAPLARTTEKTTFTEREKLKIKKMYEKGKSLAEIAEFFKSSRKLINKLCKNIGVNVTRKVILSEKDQMEIRKMFDLNYSEKKMATYFKTSRIVIRRYLFDLGLSVVERKEKNRSKYNNLLTLSKEMGALFRSSLVVQDTSRHDKILMQHFGYTSSDLKIHFEKYFKLPENLWMNFGNHGSYRIKDLKNGEEAKVWHIDHIVPQIIFKNQGLDSEWFKFCWSMFNLRPLLAKQNLQDGGLNKTRVKTFIWLLLCLFAQCHLVEQESKKA